MLKKLCVLICIVLLIKVFPQSGLIFMAKGESYTFYVGQNSSNCQIITVGLTEAKACKKNLKNLCGESFQTADKQLVDSEILRLDCTLCFSEVIGDILTSYYYSPKIFNYETINGYKVNVQVANNLGLYTLASPLIWGSF